MPLPMAGALLWHTSGDFRCTCYLAIMLLRIRVLVLLCSFCDDSYFVPLGLYDSFAHPASHSGGAGLLTMM